METFDLIRRYQLLGLRFERIEPGFVDAFTGDPALRRSVENEPALRPDELARSAGALREEVLAGSGLPERRRGFIAAHLRAMQCSARRFAGESIGFVDEVEAYFDVRISMGDEDRYREAHRELDAVLEGDGPVGERLNAFRAADEIPPERLTECVETFSSALRDRVRAVYPLPEQETVGFEIVTDKPWSGFNYYLGDYRSTVAINADLRQRMANLPHLISHEAYPGHHTEHCRKEAALVGAGEDEQTLFLVNTPQCLMAEGLADLALEATVGDGWGLWAREIFSDLGLRFAGEQAERISKASAQLLHVRQDAALMLHDRGRSADDVADFLERWTFATPERARQQLRFLSSPLWRAYISTYVEGYTLLRRWLDARPPTVTGVERFGRLLDEPLLPSHLRAELDAGR